MLLSREARTNIALAAVLTTEAARVRAAGAARPDGIAEELRLGLEQARDTILPIVPMFHANAWGLGQSGPMIGAKLVMPGGKMDGARAPGDRFDEGADRINPAKIGRAHV